MHASKLFLGFSDIDLGVIIQMLKIKPVSEWSAASINAFQFITSQKYGSQRLHPLDEYTKFADSWLYASMADNRIAENFFGADVMTVLPYSEYMLKAISRDADTPLNEKYLSEPRMINASGFYLYKPTASYKDSFLPFTDQYSGFAVPIDVIDWEKSHFTFSISRKIPTTSPLIKFHTVRFMATNLGRDVVIVGGSSGRIAQAAQRSRIALSLPVGWQTIPRELRHLPRDMNELNKYLDWLSHTTFDPLGNSLPGRGSSPSNRIGLGQ